MQIVTKDAMNISDYCNFKKVEQFVESLVFSKPVPHFVPSRHKVENKNPFGLERVSSFLNEIGSPHLKNKYIHITGTSGKTSTTYYVANVLTYQGYSTGVYISPHICSLLERFMINMQMPYVKDIINLVERLKPTINSEYENKNMGAISYFEFVLSAALKHFEENNVDYVALEVGLGGRYDATNVIEKSEVSIVTNIGLDHTHILGNTKEEIAYDKIGIAKEKCPIITAEKEPELIELFKKETKELNTTIEVLGKDFQIKNLNLYNDRTTFDYISNMNTFKDLQTNMGGEYQAENVSLAIRSLEIISEKNNRKIDENSVRKAIEITKVPARYEQIMNNPTVIIDGAHNPDKVSHLVNHLKNRYKKGEIIFVCGFTSGKTPSDMMKSMLEISNTFYLTRIISGYREDEEPLYLKSVIKDLDQNAKTEIMLDPFDALDSAIQEAKRTNKVICVTGSLYLVAYIRQRWYPEYENIKYEK